MSGKYCIRIRIALEANNQNSIQVSAKSEMPKVFMKDLFSHQLLTQK